MNRAHLRLTQSQTNPERARDIKPSPCSLINLKDSVVNYWNRGSAITAEFLHNLRINKFKPNNTKGITKGANLSGIPSSCRHINLSRSIFFRSAPKSHFIIMQVIFHESEPNTERARDIKQSPFSLTNLKDSVVNYWNRGLAITAGFLHNVRTDKTKPNDTKGINKGANLSGIPSSCRPVRSPSLDSPEPSLDETVHINRTDAVAPEEMSNRYRARALGCKSPALQYNEVEKTELGEQAKESRMITASPAVIALHERSKEIHERNQKLQDKALAERKRCVAERRRLAAQKNMKNDTKPCTG